MNTKPPTQDKIILEQNKRFSECLFWTLQREYFDQQGIQAWVNQVPYYVTSNTFIGACYAKLALRFVRDWINTHPDTKHEPFYILELGTGSGRFSFYVLKALHALKNELGMNDIKIIYVMSDFAAQNLEYYQTHDALQPFLKQGVLDFAIYNIEAEQPIQLVQSGTVLNSSRLVHPLIVFANYVFDTISQDSFYTRDGKLFELAVTLSTDATNMNLGKPIDWEKIEMEHTLNEVSGTYYNEPELDALLDFYKKTLHDTHFLIPIGSIRAIQLLKKLTNNQFFMIASDKAYTELHSLENLSYPSMAFHGSFSMMANFHAIGQYLLNSGGDYSPHSSRRGIKTSVFSSGFKHTELPETRTAIREYIDHFSPADYFSMHRYMTESSEHVGLDALAAHLQLSEWDPNTYIRLSHRISSLLEEADPDTLQLLCNNMEKIADNYYAMPNSECVLFEIGVFYHATKQYDEAYTYYKRAEHYVGEQFGLHYNTGLCLHQLDRHTEALKHFKRAVELDPDSKEASDWVGFLEKTRAERKYHPKAIQE